MSRFQTHVSSFVLAIILAWPVVAFGYINAGFRSQRAYDEYLRNKQKHEEVRLRHEQEQKLATLNSAIQRDSNDMVAVYQRGRFFQECNEFEKAMADFNTAIERAPQLARAFFRRSFLWMRNSDHRRALADLDEAIRLEPVFAPSHFHRAALLFAYRHLHERNLSDARQSIQTACDLAERRRQTRKANANQDEAAGDDFQYGQYCELLGGIAAEMGDFSAAIEWETKASQFPRRTAPQRLSRYQNHQGDADVYKHAVRCLTIPIQ